MNLKWTFLNWMLNVHEYSCERSGGKVNEFPNNFKISKYSIISI